MILKTIYPERFQQLVDEEQQAAFSSWDFHWLEGRMVQDEPPWDYPALVRKHLDSAHSILDMGTGGGELLSSLAPLPPDTHTTEAYHDRLVAIHNIIEREGQFIATAHRFLIFARKKEAL